MTTGYLMPHTLGEETSQYVDSSVYGWPASYQYS